MLSANLLATLVATCNRPGPQALRESNGACEGATNVQPFAERSAWSVASQCLSVTIAVTMPLE